MKFFADTKGTEAVPLAGSHVGGVVHPFFTHQSKDNRYRTGSVTPEKLDIHLHHYGPGGFTPPSSHKAVEQAYFVIKGRMRAKVGGEERLAGPETCIMIPRNTEHSFENAGKGDLIFLFIQCPP